MSGWRKTTLGDFVALQRGHDLPSQTRGAGLVPVMGSFGVTGYHDVAKAKGPGVTVGRSGASIGVVSYIDRDFWPLNTCMYVTDFKGNDPRFVYHFLGTLNLSGFNSGSAQPSLNRNYIYPIEIVVPEPGEQREIASILGALDDKIELNRRMAATLEEMARALYRSWFVDFDPVRAKAERLAPAFMDEATAALIPDRFAENGLPEGWDLVSIYNFARVQYGAPFKSSLFNTSQVGRPLVRIRDLKDQVAGVYTTERLAREYIIQPVDIVVGMDGDFTPYTWASEPCLMNQRVCCFIPHEEAQRAILRYALPKLLKSEEDAAVATTVIHLGKKDIDKFTIIDPGAAIVRAFGELVNPIIHGVVHLGRQNRTLLELRDTLLPKLMSGELRVREAEEQLKEVA